MATHREGNPTGDSPASRFNLIPMDRAPDLVLKMLSRFEEGLAEPMVIGNKGQPVAALIPIEDLVRLREYDERALESEDAFYSELQDRILHAETEPAMVDFDEISKRYSCPDQAI